MLLMLVLEIYVFIDPGGECWLGGAAHEEEVLFEISGQKTAQKTTRKQREILEFLKKHPDASREEIASNLSGISESGVKYNLKVLQTKGLLRRLGPDKGGHWEITK
ncbi:MAG: hypothetical protein A2351_07505 [Omnitrophica bacterium RIFOXYB12_FULL_50_7]|nr:MAG: hypothetical protein A2351_07505 [Omnitrophica bacterium RIFOXYB12_FULL_50_7]